MKYKIDLITFYLIIIISLLGVAMSEIYSDPALDVSGIKGLKKRTVSTSSIDAKSTKRRVTKVQ
jgi:hypothetical protein